MVELKEKTREIKVKSAFLTVGIVRRIGFHVLGDSLGRRSSTMESFTENKISARLSVPSRCPDLEIHDSCVDFNTLFCNLNAHFPLSNPRQTRRSASQNPEFVFERWLKRPRHKSLAFSSTSISAEDQVHSHSSSLIASKSSTPSLQNWIKPAARGSLKIQNLMKNLSVLEKAMIGAMAGGIAGAFTYVCLHPLDTIKTKLQTKGASEIYSSTFDAIVKTFQSRGILGFYSGVSAVIVGSTASSAVYFGTCEFGKSILSKVPNYPFLLIPPTAGAMGNIISSAIMVPKELITQRMQAGAKGRSWEVLLRILEKDGILGLYAGYAATLLRNLPAGVLSYSSFEYLKSAVLSTTEKGHLEPIESVCCGALAGAISASLTTPLDVVKTRLMTQMQGDAKKRIGGVSATIAQILKEEGWIGLTRGMGPRVLHSAMFAALGYFAFETARLTILRQYVVRKTKELEVVA